MIRRFASFRRNRVAELPPDRLRPAVSPKPRSRFAAVQLGRNGMHFLVLTLGRDHVSIDRERAQEMSRVFAEFDDMAILTMIAPFTSDLVYPEDISFLRDAVAAFLEELSFEDRRPDERIHPATKTLVV